MRLPALHRRTSTPPLTEEEEHENGARRSRWRRFRDERAWGGDGRGGSRGETRSRDVREPCDRLSLSGSALSAPSSRHEADAATDSDDDISFGVNLFDEDEDDRGAERCGAGADALDTFRLVVASLSFPPSRANKSDGIHPLAATAARPGAAAQGPPRCCVAARARARRGTRRWSRLLPVLNPARRCPSARLRRGRRDGGRRVGGRRGGTARRKRVGFTSAARAAAFSTVTGERLEHDVPPEHGWPSVSDAQNAAACRALFDVLGRRRLRGREERQRLARGPERKKRFFGGRSERSRRPVRARGTRRDVPRRVAPVGGGRAQSGGRRVRRRGRRGGARQSGPDARDAFAAALMAERRRRGEEASAGRKNRAATMGDEAPRRRRFLGTAFLGRDEGSRAGLCGNECDKN